MNDPSGLRQPEQVRRIHPTDAFIRFEKEETEQSIPQRFEQQVSRYPDRLAVKTRSHQLSYAALNRLPIVWHGPFSPNVARGRSRSPCYSSMML